MLEKAEPSSIPRLHLLTNWVGFGLVLVSVLAGLATFAILTNLTPITPTSEVTALLLAGNFFILILMGAMIGSQLFVLWRERRRGTPGAGLHMRLALLFSLVAVVPAIVVAVFAYVTLNRGLDTWFSQRTQAIVNSAVGVAEDYIRSAAEATRNDAASISADLVQQKELYDTARPEFVKRVARHAALRGLSGAFVFDHRAKRIDASVTVDNSVKFLVPLPDVMAKADKGELVLIPPQEGGNLVRALIKLQGYPNHYLYIYRILPPAVIGQLIKTRDAKAEYDRMMMQRGGLLATFALMYAMVAFVFLLAAIWIGLRFADRLVAPIVRLLNASRRVAQGDFTSKVEGSANIRDLDRLTRTFNFMTDEVSRQQRQLVETNTQLDERIRFSEAVLAGVSAGVIGIDQDDRISLVNRSAIQLLGVQQDAILRQPFGEALPEFSELFAQAKARPSGTSEGLVQTRVKGRDMSLFIRITTEASEQENHGYVLTFDDMTDLVSAQRNTAWADIARRIAHEIKNPLTPIQLSAERLKRKYGKQIQADRQVFEQCTETIIRQVGDIGRMVDEFSSFARMPKAVPEMMNLAEVVKDATVLQRVAAQEVQIDVNVSEADFAFMFDRRLITQAVTNLVKNAGEAIEGRPPGENLEPGRILVEAGMIDRSPFIRVVDNGVGLPTENRNRLAEPYMTTRAKGTGLGLAIVKRVIEEHGGRLRLDDAPGGRGAQVTLEFAPIPETILETA
jgi:two-component system nitrogen regulation sensor histidine kinase NtrY